MSRADFSRTARSESSHDFAPVYPSFDEIVYQFATTSEQLSQKEKLKVLKHSAAVLEQLESKPVRQTIEITEKAKERGREAARATESTAREASHRSSYTARLEYQTSSSRNNNNDDTVLDTTRDNAASTNTPASPRTPKTPRTPRPTKLVEPMQPVREIYSVHTASAPNTPTKVIMGPPEAPVVLYDYYPEPVRRRNRRPSYTYNYAKHTAPSLNIGNNNSTNNMSSSFGGMNATPNPRATPVVRTLSGLSASMASSGPLRPGRSPTSHRPVLTSPTSAVSATQGKASSRGKVQPLSMDALDLGRESSDASYAFPRSPLSRSRSKSSVQAQTPRGTCSRGESEAPFDNQPTAGGLPMPSSSSRDDNPIRKTRPRRAQSAHVLYRPRGMLPPPRNAQRRATKEPGELESAPLTPWSQSGRQDQDTHSASRDALSVSSARLELSCSSEPEPAGSAPAPAPQTAAPPLSLPLAIPGTTSAERATPVGDLSVQDSLLHLEQSLTPRNRTRQSSGTFRPNVSSVSPIPRHSMTSRSARFLYNDQRKALLDMMKDEINDIEQLQEQRREQKKKMEEERKRQPILVENLEAYPQVAHAIQLIAQNAESAFNWVMLAEAMSEAQLLPPRMVSVTYTLDETPLGVDASGPVGPVTKEMNMKEILVKALSLDNEQKSAWEGLALLLEPGEKTVVLKERTRRPMSITNVDCYIRILRIDPVFFYAWMGLGCAMLEEQKIMRAQAEAVEKQLGKDPMSCSTPPRLTPRKKSINKRRSNNSLSSSLSAVLSGTTEPVVAYSVLYGKRPFEAKDCFAHAVQICPAEASLWAQLLRCLPDVTSTVEFDAPSDERELVDLQEQQVAMEQLAAMGGGGGSGDPNHLGSSVTPEERPQMTDAKKKALSDKLLAGCTLSFSEVAAIALELAPNDKELWKYVAQRLRPSDPQKKTKRSTLSSTSRRSSGTSTAKTGSLTTRRKTQPPPSLSASTSQAGSMSMTLTISPHTHVVVDGKPFSKEQCAEKAKTKKKNPASPVKKK